MDAISKNVTAKQVEVEKCEAAAAVAQRKADWAREKAVTSEERALAAESAAMDATMKASAAQQDLKQFSASLFPLQVAFSLTNPIPPHSSSSAATISSKRPRTVDPYEEVYNVTSNDLFEILSKMHRRGSPLIYDLQGREMTFDREGDPTIYHSGVTWRNGTVRLQEVYDEQQSLEVRGKDFILEIISVVGCWAGVHLHCAHF
ncbi:MAG: hypothetical protein WDW38_006197 [Sanguina aurantia]